MAKRNARNSAKSSVRTPKKTGGSGGAARNPNSLANLQPPWQPGQPSPNPSGRPRILGEAYKEWLAKVDPETGYSRAEGVAMAMGKAALGGKVDAAREIRSATEGEQLKHSGTIQHIQFQVKYDDEQPSGDGSGAAEQPVHDPPASPSPAPA